MVESDMNEMREVKSNDLANLEGGTPVHGYKWRRRWPILASELPGSGGYELELLGQSCVRLACEPIDGAH
jgi:hypothetical protein